MSAPSYFNSASNPSDNGSANEPVTLAITPPGSMVAGDLVVMIGVMQVATTGLITISNNGGQSWSSVSEAGANDTIQSVFWCQFDGTWDANPSLAFGASGGTQATTAVMHVFRPATVGTWEVDTAYAGAAEASASPVVISGITPAKRDTVTLAGWAVPNASTWGAVSGTGWTVAGGAQYRNTAGSDLSAKFAYQCQGAPAATNDVSAAPSTQAAGSSFTMAWRVANAPTIALNTADAHNFGTDTTPTVEFTGSDGNSDDLRYNVQISDNANFSATGTVDTYADANRDNVQLISNSFWRGCQSFAVSADAVLDSAWVMLKTNTGSPTGNIYARIYAHTGTYGDGGLPTGSALAVSDAIDASTLTGTITQRTFAFSGSNRISLTNGTKYCLAVEWDGHTAGVDFHVGLDSTSPTHGGNNGYHNGGNWVSLLQDWAFAVLTTGVLLDKTSGTDAGFANTVTGGDSDPFNAGEKIGYTVQAGDALDGGTWYWRARVSDPNGGNTWSNWATARTFSVSAANGGEYVASGGASTGGAAVLAKGRSWIAAGGASTGGVASVAKSRQFGASGGLASGGAAVTLKVVAYAWAGSGGASASGAAIANKGKAFAASGGLASSGAATLAKGRGWLASGGASAAGAAALAIGKAFAAAGGLTPGGEAATQKAASFAYAGAGGLAASGAGATSFQSNSSNAYIGTGGATLGGDANSTRVRIIVREGTGGVSLAGDGLANKGKAFAAAGGAIANGAAAIAIGKAAIATGGASAGGAGALAIGKVFPTTGGIATGGAAATSLQTPASNTWVGQGGVTVAGAAVLAKWRVWIPSGGALIAGAADVAKSRQWAAAGGATLAGAAATSLTAVTVKTYAGTGGASLAGVALLAKGKAFAVAGGAAVAGAATLAKGRVWVPSGGLASSGAAATSLATASSNSYVGAGGVTVNGAATLQKGRSWIAAGGYVVSGSAATETASMRVYAGAGGFVVSGAAAIATIKAYLALGGAQAGGAADVAKGRVWVPAGIAQTGGAAACSFISALDVIVAGALLPVGYSLVLGGVVCDVVVHGEGIAIALAILPGTATAGALGVGVTPAGTVSPRAYGAELRRDAGEDTERRGDAELMRID